MGIFAHNVAYEY